MGGAYRPHIRRARGAPLKLFTGRGAPEVDFSGEGPAGNKPAFQPLVQRGAQTGIRRIGLDRKLRFDLYHRGLTISWPHFVLSLALAYGATNVFFAALYWVQPGSIANARPGSFEDAFFFSVQTLGTIGYGVLAPATLYANVLVTLEVLVGIVLVALTTGLVFARVSRPTARVLFAKVAVVTAFDGAPMLMARMGNERVSQIVQADIGMTLVRNERNREGARMRRFHDLRLERGRTPIFAMSYVAMHRIDETSPLHGMDQAMLREIGAEILITVTGLDETMAQTVHARASYLPDEIIFEHRYVDIFGVTEDGMRAIDYRRFHSVEPARATPEAAP